MQLQGFGSWFCIALPVNDRRYLSASVQQIDSRPWWLHARRHRSGEELYVGPIRSRMALALCSLLNAFLTAKNAKLF